VGRRVADTLRGLRENIANECKVAQVLALPIGTGRVRGGEGGVEVGFRT